MTGLSKRKKLIISLVIIGVIVELVLALAFKGIIDEIVYSDEYISCRWFVYTHSKNISKEKIIDRIGCPDAYVITDGETVRIPYGEEEKHIEKLQNIDTEKWAYYFNMHADGGSPYMLIIYFNDAGKIENLKFDYMPGG